jgi:hypothetical protein
MIKNSMEWIFRVLQPGNSCHDIESGEGICLALCPDAFEIFFPSPPESSAGSSDTSMDGVDLDAASPLVTAFDDDSHLSLDDSPQPPSPAGGYDDFQDEYSSTPTKIRARHAEMSLSKMYNGMTGGFRNLESGVDSLQKKHNESLDVFRRTVETHESRMRQHEQDNADMRRLIAELRNQQDRDITELKNWLDIIRSAHN